MKRFGISSLLLLASLLRPAATDAQIYAKLNGLYALVGVVNPAVEFRLTDHSAFQTEFVYSPWKSINVDGQSKPMHFGIFLNEYRYYFRGYARGWYVGGNAGAQFRAQAGALSGYVLDSLRGLREVLQYHQGENRLAGLEERTEGLLHTEERMKGRAAWSMALTNTVILTFSLGMLAAAAGLYFAGAVGFDGVLIPLTALMSSFGPVVALANLGSTLQNTLAAGNRVLDILDEEPLVHEIAGRQTTAFSGAACEDVSFSYGEEPVLSRVSLRIPQGRVVGITGRSGSGKSTLLRLLMRFWDADGGAVRVSGRDVREVNTGDLRRMEGFVTQETHLFRDSIASNLRIGKRDATQAELEAACKKASVHEFILSLPKGYDTPVGELGDTLSGGERQRLGLARAFLHDAPFLLLDEPTSNLDSLNEGVILRSLQSERGGRTVVLVSHRASTMAVADEVYAAQEGRVS